MMRTRARANSLANGYCRRVREFTVQHIQHAHYYGVWHAQNPKNPFTHSNKC